MFLISVPEFVRNQCILIETVYNLGWRILVLCRIPEHVPWILHARSKRSPPPSKVTKYKINTSTTQLGDLRVCNNVIRCAVSYRCAAMMRSNVKCRFTTAQASRYFSSVVDAYGKIYCYECIPFQFSFIAAQIARAAKADNIRLFCRLRAHIG